MNPATVWCDAVALADLARESRWAEALALYRGDLLEGLHAEGVSQEFEDWLEDRRRSLREQAAAAAWECSRIEEERGDRKAAAVMARRALDLTPDDEAGVRRLIELLDRHGDRGGALRVYDEWKARLQSEFGVEPAPETRKLIRRVQAARKGESHETPPTSAHIPPAGIGPRAMERTHEPDAGALGPAASSSTRAGNGPFRWRTAVAGVSGLVLLSVLAWAISHSVRQSDGNSIAALPVRTLGDSSLRALSLRITESLTDRLVAMPDLRVRPATYARAAVTAGGDVDEIGRRLRVAFVIDGNLQANAHRYRVGVRLVRTHDGIAVWAGSADCSDTTLDEAVGTLAQSIAAIVRGRMRSP